MTGRRPKPTATKRLQGRPGHSSPINTREPVPTRGQPVRPSFLGPHGNELWIEVSKYLDDMQILTVPDGPALALLCATWEDYRQARKIVDELGFTVEQISTTGNVMIKKRPEVEILSDCARRLQSLLVEFGLTPSARTRVKMSPEPTTDPLEELLHATG